MRPLYVELFPQENAANRFPGETLEKEEEFHMVVIALDLWNFKSFPCFIADFDESTRFGRADKKSFG